MTIPRLLVVDDDPEMRGMMTEFMQQNGFIALSAANQDDILQHLKIGRIDLILLDVMLGNENGLEICATLRTKQNVPIIIVSALSADSQRMAGYEAGADDYIAKPFNPDLLLARVRAVLYRARRTSSLIYRRSTKIFQFADWIYDSKRDEVTSPQGFQVSLSQRETAFLKVLLANPRIPLTREEIAKTLDDTESSGRAIDVLVGRLRSKIEQNPKDPRIIKTERGIGYVMALDVITRDD